MKNILLSIFAFFIVLSANAQNKVLLLGIDGCRASALLAANTPNIDTLLNHATYSFDALTQYPTWSGPGWSSMLTGVWEEKHGVLDNSFLGSNYNTYPHFIKRIEQLYPAKNTASVAQWSPINDNILQSSADFEINLSQDVDVKTQAVNILNNQNPDVLCVHFNLVDAAGHSYGFDPSVPQYISAIQTADSYIGEILTALRNRANYNNENWLIIVAPDHGGNLDGHGGAAIEERNIFTIFHNKNLPTNPITKTSTNVVMSNVLKLNGNNQYILPANQTVFNFGANQDFSVELRIKYNANNATGDAAFIGNKNWNSGFNKGFVISTPTDELGRWKVNIADGIFRTDLTGSFIGDNNWHTIAVTFDRNGRMTLYEDGIEAGWQNMNLVGNINSGLPLVIGQDGTLGYADWFNGAIAEVRIWNTVLSPTAIAQYACSSVTPTHPNYANLIAYWKINEGTGTTINEPISGQSATLTGGTPNWQPDNNMVCNNYQNVPQMPDIAVTALAHLCIDAAPTWQLDGHIVVDTRKPNIIGTPDACQNGIQTFNVVAGAAGTTYNWTVTGGTIIAGQGTNQITVQWSNNTAGTVSVLQTNP